MASFPNADRAPTARARCLHCREAIAKDSIRIVVARVVDTPGFKGQTAGYEGATREGSPRSWKPFAPARL